MSTADSVLQGYKGKSGVDYHAKVHSSDPWVQDVVARSRVLKFEHLVQPDDDVLEYGVGMGLNIRHLRARRRVGFDVSDAGRAACGHAGIEFRSELSSIEGQQFSVVICHHVLEHVADPVGTLETIKRFLKPGGRMILCVPFETARYYRRYIPNDPNRHIFAWNPLTLGNLATVVGFEVESSSIGPFSYEQRLAFLARAGFVIYRLGLWALRTIRPDNEVFLVARKPIA